MKLPVLFRPMTLSPVERAALIDLLENGDNVPANIADSTGKHPKSLIRSLKNLEERGYVINKGRGVYRLTTTGTDLAALAKESDNP